MQPYSSLRSPLRPASNKPKRGLPVILRQDKVQRLSRRTRGDEDGNDNATSGEEHDNDSAAGDEEDDNGDAASDGSVAHKPPGQRHGTDSQRPPMQLESDLDLTAQPYYPASYVDIADDLDSITTSHLPKDYYDVQTAQPPNPEPVIKGYPPGQQQLSDQLLRRTDVGLANPDDAPEASHDPRQKTPVRITISDDRSKGSEFEQTRRILVALEPRVIKQNHSQFQPQNIDVPKPEPSGSPSMQPNISAETQSTVHQAGHAHEPVPFYEPIVLGRGYPPPGGYPPGPRGYPPGRYPPPGGYQYPPPGGSMRPMPAVGGSGLALQDYQLQLMLLEQQNKKRLMMSRQERDAVEGSRLPQLFSPEDSPSTAPMAIQVRSHESTVYESSVQPADRMPGVSANVDATQVPPAYPLNGPAVVNPPRSIEIGTLGLPAEATISLEAMQAYIADLQERCRPKEKPLNREPSRWQIIYRIKNGQQGSRMFLDHPQWTVGENNSRALTSSLPISSMPAYLSKHPDISFVVYRDYDPSAMKTPGASDDDSGTLPIAKHTSENIEPATADLRMAVTALSKYSLKSSLRDRPNVIRILDDLTSPYLVIYHGRSKMGAFLEGLPPQQRLQFQLLLDYVLSQFVDEYGAVDALLEKGMITYSYIKYLFMPGDVLVEGNGQASRAYLCTSWLHEKRLVLSTRSKTDAKVDRRNVDCESWEFDGSFALQETSLTLKLNPNDESALQIDDLSVRPLKFLGEVADRLRRRGEMFWKCRVRHLVSYHEDAGRDSHHSGDERFMIDLDMYRELHKREDRSKFVLAFADDLGPEITEKDTPPDGDFVYLLPPTIKGYNLKRKKWLDIYVDRVSEVVWNKDAFESLVLDRKTKRLIRALVSNQIEAEKATDLISGKGNGLVLLLHGGPGTGKTLTAESVAEIAEKPLYPVTCGDIGTEPEMVETYLESVLNLGKTWGCVVLLDEADVFLEQRSLEDLQRNALVSVFLRVLEYYEGILILTSNRVGTFDEAFKSRIQLALHYPNLSTFQRVQIWRNFISRLEKLQETDVNFDDLTDHVEDLAKHKMNGREIRNVITTARQYAKWECQVLDYNLMKEIIETAGRFDLYIQKLSGGYTQDQLAEDEGLRLAKAV